MGKDFSVCQEILSSVSEITLNWQCVFCYCLKQSLFRVSALSEASYPGLTVCFSLCVGAANIYQDKACSAENCREGRDTVEAFTVHVSDKERFHFISQCCQGKQCNDTTDALGGCWQCATLPLSAQPSPFFCHLWSSSSGGHLKSKHFIAYLGNINSWLTTITWKTNRKVITTFMLSSFLSTDRYHSTPSCMEFDAC